MGHLLVVLVLIGETFVLSLGMLFIFQLTLMEDAHSLQPRKY